MTPDECEFRRLQGEQMHMKALNPRLWATLDRITPEAIDRLIDDVTLLDAGGNAVTVQPGQLDTPIRFNPDGTFVIEDDAVFEGEGRQRTHIAYGASFDPNQAVRVVNLDADAPVFEQNLKSYVSEQRPGVTATVCDCTNCGFFGYLVHEVDDLAEYCPKCGVDGYGSKSQ